MLLIHSYLLLVFCIQLNIYIEFKINYTKMTIMSKKSASQCKQISEILFISSQKATDVSYLGVLAGVSEQF